MLLAISHIIELLSDMPDTRLNTSHRREREFRSLFSPTPLRSYLRPQT